MKTIYCCFLFIISIVNHAIAQSVTFTPSALVVPNVGFTTTAYELSTANLPVPHIKINLSGFSCSPLTYNWRTVSWTPVWTPISPGDEPLFRHPLTNPYQPDPSPNSAVNANSARYRISGPGIYTLELCVTACGGTQTACGQVQIVAKPLTNINPSVVFEDITALTLPIAGSEQLDVIVEDITDAHNFTWSQSGANPVSLSLPSSLSPATNPTNIPRGSSPTLSQLNLSGINKPGTYSFTVNALDERSGTGTATETFLVKPAASTLAINITQPGNPPDLSVLFTPVNNVPLNAEITGINTFNDKILYTWSQIAGPTTITLPTPAYTANIASIPVASSTFTVPAINLNGLAYGVYTLRLRAEDEYYPGTFVEQDVTFTVKPPESDLSVSISPLEDIILTKKINIFEIEPQKTIVSEFIIEGRTNGINEYSDVIRTYWQIIPEVIDIFDPTPIEYTMGTDFDMQNIPIGTTTITNILKLEPTKIKAGVYIVRYTAEDSFYNKKAESFMKILIKRPVDIIPSVAFSPNEDNQNDVWNVKNIESFPDVGVRVVNERGELVFETVSVASLPEKGWNGRRKDGKLASEGAYYYEFYNNQDQSKLNVGSFVIVR